MSRKSGITRAQVDRLRELNRLGLSANEIQRVLKKENLGFRRTILLRYIRELRGKPAPVSWEKNIPIKYRKKPPRPPPLPPYPFPVKRIAVYGFHHNVPKRIQMFGSGDDLMKAMQLARFHPPRTRFLEVDARAILHDPDYYLDMDDPTGYWDRTPEVES